MKKSELKALLKIIAEEVAAAKKSRIDETKGLSGFKKTSDKVEHTEKVADSKSLTPTSEPKEKEEGKKLPVVKKPATPQKVGDLKEGFGDMLQGYADWSLFIKDAFAVGAVSLALLLAGYLWLSDKIKSGIRNFVVKRFGAELDTYLAKRADEIRNDPAIQKALADPKHTGLYIAIKAKLNQQDLEMNKKVRGVFGKDIVPSLARVVQTQPATGTDLKEDILQMIREEIEEMARVKGAVGSKFKVEDPSSPTGWVVKGHKTIPDGTPTEAPKGPYVKKGTNPNMGRPKSTPSVPAGSSPATDARTEEAIEDYIKFNPNAPQQEILDAISDKSTEETPLNLDPAFVGKVINKVKLNVGSDTDASEPDIAKLAAAEKAAKDAKINKLRAYLMKKKGLK